MCQLSFNPMHTIIEVSEIFQEFLRLASLDGLIESWCLEITLQAGSSDILKDTYCMQHLLGLHSLSYLTLKKLDEQYHNSSSESCSCSWESSKIPEFQHSHISRYTPGTIIRWSQGACHILLAPVQEKISLNQWTGEGTTDAEGTQQDEDFQEGENPQEELENGIGEVIIVANNNGKNTSSTEEKNDADTQTDIRPCDSDSDSKLVLGEKTLKSVIPSSQDFIKHQHFCDEEVDCHAASSPQEEENFGSPETTDPSKEEEDHGKDECHPSSRGTAVILEDSFTNGLWEDDENSRMLVINEDITSQEEDPRGADDEENPVGEREKEDKGEDKLSNTSCPPTSPVSFHHVLPLTVNNVRALSGERVTVSHPVSSSPTPNQGEEEEDEEEDDNNEDSSSSVSSSSSSSSSTSLSSTSSDDDDRINFKKIVEQAAQAAREAAAARTMPPQETPNTQIVQSCSEEVMNSFLGGVTQSDSDMRRNTVSTPLHLQTGAPLAAYRNPDDIQAAQGLAALGKSHEFKSNEMLPARLGPRSRPKVTCKITQKLLQLSNGNVRRMDRRNFQCGVCGEAFSRMCKALEHNLTHTGQKPWECDSCDKKYAKHHSLQKHKKAKHLKEFTCYICNKHFGVQSVLKSHLATHATNKPFSCGICGKTFALKFTKMAHEAQHTGNRPWGCSVCGKTFVTKYKLKAHSKGHTGELFCSICSRTFSSQDVLTRHKRRHEDTKEAQTAAPSKQVIAKALTQPGSKGRRRNNAKGNVPTAPFAGPPPHPAAPLGPSSGFWCQMCNKIFGKSTDLTHHLASCNAITYCPPPAPPLQTGLLTEGSIHPQQETPQNSHPLLPPSASPLITCLLVEEKKLFPSCDAANSVGQELENLDRRGFLMNPLQPQNLPSLTSFQHQESIIQATPNPVPEGLPDYLSEVAFGTTSTNASAIIFQPPNGQG